MKTPVMLRWIVSYWKTLLVLLAILVLSFMNPPSLPPSVTKLFSFDKLGHLMMYAGFTFVLLLDTSSLTGLRNPRRLLYLIGIAIPLSLGAITEILQTVLFSPRAAEWGDFLSDTAGVFVGWLAFLVWRKWRQRCC